MPAAEPRGDVYGSLQHKLERRRETRLGHHPVVEQGVIDEAEAALGFELPPSYTWWLRAYGGARVGGSEVMTLAPADFRDDADADIVQHHRLNRADPDHARRLYVFVPSAEEAFYFDLTQRSADGELPVVREDRLGGDDELFAIDFAHFLERLVDRAS